jgi:hypothetical protein
MRSLTMVRNSTRENKHEKDNATNSDRDLNMGILLLLVLLPFLPFLIPFYILVGVIWMIQRHTWKVIALITMLISLLLFVVHP